MSIYSPQLSIIIPVYNVAEYLPACLDSVLSQSYSDFEVIAVNDGSPDNSLDILQEYATRDNRVKIVSKNNNEGLNMARLSGLEEAKGKYIWYVDSDDEIMPRSVERIMSKALEKDLDIVCFNYEYIHRGSPIEITQVYFEDTNNIEALKVMLLATRWTVWTYVHKRELYERMGNDTLLLHKNVRFAEDALMTPKLFNSAQTVSKINDSLYRYYYRDNSLSSQKILTARHYQDISKIATTSLRDVFTRFGTEQLFDRELTYLEMTLVLITINYHNYSNVRNLCRSLRPKLRRHPDLLELISTKERQMLRFYSSFCFLDHIKPYFITKRFLYNKCIDRIEFKYYGVK